MATFAFPFLIVAAWTIAWFAYIAPRLRAYRRTTGLMTVLDADEHDALAWTLAHLRGTKTILVSGIISGLAALKTTVDSTVATVSGLQPTDLDPFKNADLWHAFLSDKLVLQIIAFLGDRDRHAGHQGPPAGGPHPAAARDGKPLMLGLLGTLLGSLSSGLLAPILGYATNAKTIEIDGFKSAAGLDTDAYKAALAAEVRIAELRAAQNGFWGARAVVVLAGGSAALHFSAVMLDSTFRFGWGVPKVPPPYDGYEWAIVQSFFLLAPTMPLASAVSAWLHRK